MILVLDYQIKQLILITISGHLKTRVFALKKNEKLKANKSMESRVAQIVLMIDSLTNSLIRDVRNQRIVVILMDVILTILMRILRECCI